MKKTAIQSPFLARSLELARWFGCSVQSVTGGPESAFEANGEIRGCDCRVEGFKLAPTVAVTPNERRHPVSSAFARHLI